MRLPDACPQRQSLEPARAPDAAGGRNLFIVVLVSGLLVLLAALMFSTITWGTP